MKREDLVRILAVVGGAVILVGALVVATRVGNHSSKPSASNISLDSVNEMLSGIPQKGIELGRPTAKVTLVEFSDPQCPWCGRWARETFPTLVQDYVRTGKLRIEYRGVDIVDTNVGGTDSDRLMRLAQAAGLQNRLWYVVELEFDNQGSEGSGYATDPFLKAIANGVKGLNAGEALAAANTNAVTPMMAAAQALAAKQFPGLQTPSFLVERTGSSAKPTKIVGAQPLATFTKAIDALSK